MTGPNDDWEVAPMDGALGAYVQGVDPARLDHPEVRTAIEALLLERHVLGVRNQHLDAAAQVRLGEHFGLPYVHPHLEAVDGQATVLRVHKASTDSDTFGGEFWHADITFEHPPAAVSLLQALRLPSAGGDTLFADQHAAHDQLPADLHAAIRDRSAVHLYPDMSEGTPHSTAVHPVIRKHDVTQRPALFVNPAFTVRFVGSTVAESESLLRTVFEHQVAAPFRARLCWEPGMLAIWDNRSVLHHAVNDYAGETRTLQRVTAMQR